jgi:hypothetical protein
MAPIKRSRSQRGKSRHEKEIIMSVTASVDRYGRGA